ncbi:erg24, C-14 sterol reductase, partial [Spiromyces aspiralis]
MPGKSISGTPLRDGRRLMYLINGLNSLIVTVGLGFYVAWRYGSEPFIWVADHYIQFVFASWAFATGLAVFVYLYSFRSADVMLALGGNSGNVIYDFFIGRELNPRIGSFDIKYFCELRP